MAKDINALLVEGSVDDAMSLVSERAVLPDLEWPSLSSIQYS